MFFAEKLPPEIAHLAKTHKELVEGKGVAYVVFSLQDRHVAAASLKKTGELLGNFRAYLAYHMKCCKAYLHFRMRDKVATWLQVLNRTKRESLEEKKKKTITGRTFTRK
jgi:actin related protein 2/3 complex subunit 2